ncbi:hypothetical protein GUJ93_ZPchr0007g5932 [Zizania palustris]|uniref:Uncharacterized protein n=1 Tax=Zizania palustris TaxID=103762 RepID=A0A8J5TEP9_ZIZPA|nr:hypothetical protein GUJ93_ZPchr0007g5932 [Zizania palustris]
MAVTVTREEWGKRMEGCGEAWETDARAVVHWAGEVARYWALGPSQGGGDAHTRAHRRASKLGKAATVGLGSPTRQPKRRDKVVPCVRKGRNRQ